MKKLLILLVSSATVFLLFTECSNPSTQELCSNTESRRKIIAELVNNPDYMNEFVDSVVQSLHGTEMIVKNQHLMRSMISGKGMNNVMMSDISIKNMMMNNMMDMCNTDTSMCKMMMGKTMDMCDANQANCIMMVNSIKEHPKGMKLMKAMGM